MLRVARIVIPNYPQHSTERGNNRQAVFFVEDDRTTYLARLSEESHKYGVRVEGYCLMTNHVHLLPIPYTEQDRSPLTVRRPPSQMQEAVDPTSGESRTTEPRGDGMKQMTAT
jgi:REP element-mobilizing transposase RayT